MIIAVVTNKGGVGKTTTAITIGHLLALKAKTLIIDVDSQCNTTSTLAPRIDNLRTLYDIMCGTNKPQECIYNTPIKNFDVIPNSEDTTALEPIMLSRPDMGYNFLREVVRPFAESYYEHTIIDCPPNLGLYTVQAMVCADSVIVPVEAGSKYAVDGLEKTINSIQAIQQSYHPNLKLLKILVTMADMRTVVDKTTYHLLKENFGDLLFEQVISRNTDVKQAEMFRKTLIRYKPNSSAAMAYKKVVKELLKIMKG